MIRYRNSPIDDFDDDEYLDTCLGCGGTTWAHRGVLAWDQQAQGCIAPQLCPRCWRAQGYAWPTPLSGGPT
jgi:hypothetical protein